ncbi:MAG: hypothetical protein QM702_03380 [Rubrivivax sp.]
MNFDDLLILARRYGKTATAAGSDWPINAQLAKLDATFGGDWALAQSLVPEPSLAAMLATLTLIGRRRPRRSADRVTPTVASVPVGPTCRVERNLVAVLRERLRVRHREFGGLLDRGGVELFAGEELIHRGQFHRNRRDAAEHDTGGRDCVCITEIHDRRHRRHREVERFAPP